MLIQPRFDALKFYLTLNVFTHYRRHYHPRPSLHSSLADSQNSTGLTGQAFLIHCSAKNVLIMWLVFSITAFCIRIYRAGRRLSSLELSCNLHRIKPLVDCKLRLKYDDTRAEIRFRLTAKHTSPFKSAGASVQSTTGSRSVRISGSNAGYTMFRGSVKGTGYQLHSPVSPSLPLSCDTVCHHISTRLYLLTYSLHGAESFLRS